MATAEQIVVSLVIKCPLASSQIHLDQFPFLGLPSPGVTERFWEGQWEVGLPASLCTQGRVPWSRWPEDLRSGRPLASCCCTRIPGKWPKPHIRVPRVQSGMFSHTRKMETLPFSPSLPTPGVSLSLDFYFHF